MTSSIERVLIVDDERLARVRVAERLRAIAPNVAVQEAADGASAARLVDSWHPDAVFLDVQMPEMDGFAVVQAVGAERMPPTVFVTAYDQHALHAFDVAAVDYLLKPFDDERFAAAWDRLNSRAAAGTIAAEARRVGALLTSLGNSAAPSAAHGHANGNGHGAGHVNGASNGASHAASHGGAPGGSHGVGAGEGHRPPYIDRMIVRRDQRTYFVRLADVQWIESSGNYVILHAGKERHEVRETLQALEARLDPRRFTRIHRRLIVALDAIRELQPWFGGDQVMILQDGTKLRVSRTHRVSLERALRGE